jgi:creatinine amidohydrolase
LIEGVPEQRFCIEHMTSNEVREAMKETGIVIVHVGSMEQHGPHLPINADTVIGAEVSRRGAAKFLNETGRRVLVAPSICFGLSPHHMAYPGTITLQPETLVAVMTDICLGLSKQGFKKILVTSSHGGNVIWTAYAVRKVYEQIPGKILLLDTVWTNNKEDSWEQHLKAGRGGSGHACETETSILMALGVPVREELIPSEPTKWRLPPLPSFWSMGGGGAKISGLSWSPTYRVEEICDGWMGDPAKATPETGAKILENWSRNVLQLLKEYDAWN